MNIDKVMEVIKRDAVSIYSEESLAERLKKSTSLKIKLGADPSRPDLHLGHSVALRKLKLLQDMGHEIVFVIGDFTGMIGDPTGKSKTRVPLTFEQTRANAKSYIEQVTKILDKAKTTVVYNSEWLAKMTFEDVLHLASKYTLARIMERDDFAKRYGENQSIGVHEIFYPLMQGYDSVALNADIEVGGTDQTFNLLVGRELQRDYGQIPQEVITFPLLPGLDGVEKMSKSLDNYIGIDESADIMFEKCMKVPDEILSNYYRLTTDLDDSSYVGLIQNDIRQAHFNYAFEIVNMYKGELLAQNAKARYMQVASGGVPQDLTTIKLPRVSVTVVDIMKKCGFATSNSDARRLILGNGVKIDNVVVTDPSLQITEFSDFIIKKGKNKFVKVTF